MSNEAALIAAIDGENAAIYAYGVIAAHVGGGAKRRALLALGSHRSWLDRWSGLLTETHSPPMATAYDFPFPVVNAETARQLAPIVENRLVVVYADLAAASRDQVRSDAVLAAAECATRAVTWGASSQAFPHDFSSIPSA
ncbi:MAG: ferritin-like domain-containing protein [Actinomycetes bacterium]